MISFSFFKRLLVCWWIARCFGDSVGLWKTNTATCEHFFYGLLRFLSQNGDFILKSLTVRYIFSIRNVCFCGYESFFCFLLLPFFFFFLLLICQVCLYFRACVLRLPLFCCISASAGCSNPHSLRMRRLVAPEAPSGAFKGTHRHFRSEEKGAKARLGAQQSHSGGGGAGAAQCNICDGFWPLQTLHPPPPAARPSVRPRLERVSRAWYSRKPLSPTPAAAPPRRPFFPSSCVRAPSSSCHRVEAGARALHIAKPPLVGALRRSFWPFCIRQDETLKKYD